MTGIARSIMALASMLLAIGCQEDPTIETVITSQVIPTSENGVYTDNGRFFVAGGDTIFEVLGGPDEFRAVPLVKQETCIFGGLVDRGDLLFASCTHLDLLNLDTRAELLRIDPRRGAPSVERAVFPAGDVFVHPNGLEFGPDGALYVTNSAALLLGEPAIFRVEIVSESPLAIQISNFLDASTLENIENIEEGGGLFPNGLRFDGSTLYYSRGATLVKMQVLPDGSHGPMTVVYRTRDLISVIDDFDINNGNLYIAQTHSLGALDTNLFKSKLVVTDLRGRVRSELVLPFVPSSTAVRRNTLFGTNTVIATSVFQGGLYRITADLR